jgi:transcriptional regulator with XRE-family HTH domain
MAHEQRLKKFLASRGITQTFVARKTGMKISTLNGILNGHVSLKTSVLEDICNAIGAKPADFFAFKCLDSKSETS